MEIIALKNLIKELNSALDYGMKDKDFYMKTILYSSQWLRAKSLLQEPIRVTSIMFSMICLVTIRSMSMSSKFNSIYSKFVYHTPLING